VFEYAHLFTTEAKRRETAETLMEVWQIPLKVTKVSCMAQYTLLMLSACSHTTSCRTHVNYIFTWL